MTLPGWVPVISTEQLLLELLMEERVQVEDEIETMPLVDVVQVTVPVGECPFTMALQVMVLDEAAGTLAGLQETEVVEVSGVTARVDGPAFGALLASPT
jgi:hypothetical protein